MFPVRRPKKAKEMGRVREKGIVRFCGQAPKTQEPPRKSARRQGEKERWGHHGRRLKERAGWREGSSALEVWVNDARPTLWSLTDEGDGAGCACRSSLQDPRGQRAAYTRDPGFLSEEDARETALGRKISIESALLATNKKEQEQRFRVWMPALRASLSLSVPSLARPIFGSIGVVLRRAGL